MTKKQLIILIINSVLCVSMITGTAVYSSLTKELTWWMQSIFYVIAIACLAVSLVLLLIKKEFKWREALNKLAVVVAAFAAFLLIIFMISLSVLNIKSADDLSNMVQGTGAWGMVVYVLIQVLQVVVLPLPAAICYGAGMLLYQKAWLVLVLSTVGVLIGSVINFFIGRVFGFRVVAWIAGKEETQKYADLFGRRGKALFVVLQLLPFFPDDILCMVAGLTSMKFSFFFLVMLLVRPLVIAVYCYGFQWIPFNEPWGIAVWVAIIAVCVVFAFLFTKYQDQIEKWFKRVFSGKEKEEGVQPDTVPPKGDYTVADPVANKNSDKRPFAEETPPSPANSPPNPSKKK